MKWDDVVLTKNTQIVAAPHGGPLGALHARRGASPCGQGFAAQRCCSHQRRAAVRAQWCCRISRRTWTCCVCSPPLASSSPTSLCVGARARARDERARRLTLKMPRGVQWDPKRRVVAVGWTTNDDIVVVTMCVCRPGSQPRKRAAAINSFVSGSRAWRAGWVLCTSSPCTATTCSTSAWARCAPSAVAAAAA